MDTDLARRLEGQTATEEQPTTPDDTFVVVAPVKQAEPTVEPADPGDATVVFAFRLTLRERDALKAAAKAQGWGRKEGGVTGWARAALAACAEAAAGPMVDPAPTTEGEGA